MCSTACQIGDVEKPGLSGGHRQRVPPGSSAQSCVGVVPVAARRRAPCTERTCRCRQPLPDAPSAKYKFTSTSRAFASQRGNPSGRGSNCSDCAGYVTARTATERGRGAAKQPTRRWSGQSRFAAPRTFELDSPYCVMQSKRMMYEHDDHSSSSQDGGGERPCIAT